MPRRSLSFVFTLILQTVWAAHASAHEFNLLLLAPEAATQAELDSMRAAFLIASHERDDHPDETSEGHLGGLDVQLTLARVDEAASADATDFVVAPFAAPGDPRVLVRAAVSDAVIVDATAIAQVEPEERRDLAPFADRFQTETGRTPDDVALGAYRAARVVDLIVRRFGSVDDRDALRRALGP
ncbi:hypothetical protein OU426_04350 [Frigidibacter sp. RF13]|uniref:hypothetical protein n=1 Tax=Frigidibacter sp. RF13 TaxID=2997340 RepID=UPI0022714DDF|nr:hypothetical protein [Frigidibacter sp. RF13]MCY1126076.1 hypothetical protein [Frigidibacter sp. RF13]